MQEHQLLCQPLNNLQSLRRWLIELREFKPSLASRVTQPKDITVADVPKVGTQPPEGEPVSYRGMTSTGLQKEGESNAARISEFAFCRLLNDLDPLARLRDAAFELSMHTTQLSLKLPAPRHASRLAAETRGARWEHLGEAILSGLDALEAHLKAHTLGFVRQQLQELLPPPEQPYSRVRPPPPEMPPPRPPPYDVERSSPMHVWDEPPRKVFAAHELSVGPKGVGGAIGCIGVVPQKNLVPQRLGGRPLTEHLALEVAASRALADATELFTRSVGYLLAPPSARQREHEAHVVFEPLPSGTPLSQLIASNGPLRSLGGTYTEGNESPASIDLRLRRVLSLWGRQLLLALKAAHARGILLRTLRPNHIIVSSDGQRIKLGPSALANFALADGSYADGGGRLISANDLPPLDGPLSDAIQKGASLPSKGKKKVKREVAFSWGTSATSMKGARGDPMDESYLPPELLSDEVLRSLGPPDKAPVEEKKSNEEEEERLSAACDVWNFGQFLFEAYYGEPPASYPEMVLKHCNDLGLQPRNSAPYVLASNLVPLPSHHMAKTTGKKPAVPEERFMHSSVRHYVPGQDELGIERMRQLDTVAPFAYDPFAAVRKPTNGSEGKFGMTAPLSSARAKVDATQLPSVSLARAAAMADKAHAESGSDSETTVTGKPPAFAPDDALRSVPSLGQPGVPEVPDVIAACLMAHPDARPSVDALLSSKLFAIDQSTLLVAKRAAAQYVRLPRPDRFVEQQFGAKLKELHKLRMGSGLMAVQSFEALLQDVLDACTNPMIAMTTAHADKASAALAKDTTASTAQAAAASKAEGPPVNAAEAEACRELMVELIEKQDVWGCLRFMCLHDLHENVSVGENLMKTDPRCTCLLKLGRALRTAIAAADSNAGAFLRPHAASLLYQLVLLASGDVSLVPTAILAEAWHPSHMKTPGHALVSLAERSSDREAAEAAAYTAAAAAAAAAGGGATGGGMPPISPLGVKLSASELYTSMVHRIDGEGAAWQFYAPETTRRWSPTLQSALHPILETVLSEDGGGSFSLPSLREALRNQTAAAAANAKAAGDTGPGANPKYENFNAGSPASRGEARGGLRRNRVLTRGYCTEVVAALAGLRSLQPSAPADYGREARRARVTALVHFAGMLRRKPAIRLCVDLQVPQHAFTALSDPEAEVKAAALDLFIKIAQLPPEPPPEPDGSGDGSSLQGAFELMPTCAPSLLRSCFGQHAMMHALARPLHDTQELKIVRANASS